MKSLILCALVFLAAFGSVSAEAKRLKRKPAEAVAAKMQMNDTVKKISEDDGGITVLFKVTPGAFYLSLDTADYDKMRKLIEASLKDKKPVSVTVNPALSNIVEVK